METPALVQKKCREVPAGTLPLDAVKVRAYLDQLKSWELTDDRTISRKLVTKDFLAAVSFINRIAELAEGEDHHPDLHLIGYRNLVITLSTHSIGGLSENDFILAAKIDRLVADNGALLKKPAA